MSRKNNYVTHQILRQYVISMILFVVGIPALIFFAVYFISKQTWYPEDPTYQLLNTMVDNFYIIVFVIYLTGIIGITVYFMKKPIAYMNEIVDASLGIANPTEDTIQLSKPLKSLQNELNLAREKGMRNAMIAREAEQRKNDLVIYLAHDLKTPLTSILGYLGLLRDEPELSSETRSKYTKIAIDKAERLDDLVNEFFDIMRFNLTTQIVQSESIDLSCMLNQITYEFLPILKVKNLEFDLQIPQNIQCICDSDKLERVFDNLIRNAINYSFDNSKIQLTLSESINKIELKLLNHGKTIPKEMLPHIFEQFFRLDSARRSTSGGAGLGLAIAKEIIELHHGTICVTSECDIIEFTISLPK